MYTKIPRIKNAPNDPAIISICVVLIIAPRDFCGFGISAEGDKDTFAVVGVRE
jgi:hypothetical protein